MSTRFRIGTAGWSIHRQYDAAFPAVGAHLQRYGASFNAAEINSSFYRPHRRSTYERWAALVPESFRFAVKLPKAITHEQRLKESGDLLDRFLEESSGLGSRLGPILVQLPPSLAFQPGTTDAFLTELRSRVTGGIVCEPRHRSWFEPKVGALLEALRIGRVAADPPPAPAAAMPGGWRGLCYIRLHGSPRIYYSPYDERTLRNVATQLAQASAAGAECWCILDNTAAFAATGNALQLQHMLRER